MVQINVGKFGEILNERPEGMSYKEYRTKRKEQCLKLRGYNIAVPNPQGGKPMIKHVMGRLEGILIPSEPWTNSRDFVVVLK